MLSLPFSPSSSWFVRLVRPSPRVSSKILCLVMVEVPTPNHGRYLAKENIIEVITLGSSTTYLIWVTMWDSSGYEEMVAGSKVHLENLQTNLSAIALFFAWIEMTLMLGRRPSIGKYTYMSIQVTF